MGKIRRVKVYSNDIFDPIEDPAEKRAAYVHSYGVAQNCAMLALKRGLNPELATVIGLLHDIYSYKTGVINSLHGPNGAEMVRVAFKNELSGIFTDEEQLIIKSAIFHHSDKAHIHDAYDELLKDSDLLQHWLNDISSYKCKGDRLLNVIKELRIPQPILDRAIETSKDAQPFNPSHFANIAKALAKKKIVGERANAEYMRIIRYFPEETAFDELKNAWCAAFVYHCLMEAGVKLPIRTVHTAKKIADCRLACVVAWYEWGSGNGFCHTENDGFIPERGDIVIYNNIIPQENKPENSAGYDHIGIVLSCDVGSLTVAEGNVGNQNVSGIVARRRDDTVGCYIRIPSDYLYDEWKIDYKTGERK